MNKIKLTHHVVNYVAIPKFEAQRSAGCSYISGTIRVHGLDVPVANCSVFVNTEYRSEH